MSTEPDNDDIAQDNGEELSAAEIAMLEKMQADTPMPDGDAPDGQEKAEPTEGELEAKAKPDDEDDDDPDLTIDEKGRARDKDGKFVESVPKSAFLRIKEQSKARAAELAAEREEKARVLGRMNLLTEIINAGGEKKAATDDKKDTGNPWDEKDIDPQTDIVAAFDQQKRRAEFNRRMVETDRHARSEHQAEVARVNAYVSDVQRICNEQATKGEVVEIGGKAIPVYAAAYKHLVNLRHAQLEAVGVADKATREQIIGDEEKQIVSDAAKAKRSPAEAIYKLALASGFTVPAKKSADNGASPAEKNLQRVNDGMKATKSLSSAGGAAYGGLTTSQIVNMNDDEFAAFASKLSEAQLEKLLGA
jgi:hypothetical protein